MGTHPIFESDFDCLTEISETQKKNEWALGFNDTADGGNFVPARRNERTGSRVARG